MGSRTALAALLLTVVPLTVVPLATPPAAADAPATSAAPATIAYAKRTQAWELVLSDGRVVKVPEALTKAPADAVNPGVPAPFLVSRDGRHIFYFRRSDGVFVERTVRGAEHVVSRRLTAFSIGEEWPDVSDDGGYVVTTTSGPGVGIFADLRKGKVLPPPGRTDAWSFLGFSPDGGRLLLAQEDRLTVFDRTLRARVSRKTRLSATALANDHVTVAALVGRWPNYRQVRLLNLRTGRTSRTVTVRLPRGQWVDDLSFDRADHLIVRSRTRTGVTIYRVSAATGRATPLRKIARPDTTVWVLPGDSTYEAWTERKRRDS
ncbi:hypothetical protein [Microbispora amethystogenes]|uniref:Uncharacterized protein n=1 Tax=Microbispora amethystogenes TaxID=1427754 RepID=A0ABQ4FDB1_9ACTN|nr:hypothetical protein [Microbispora amethystogenes]GIH32768.1 hypothetical protein Mam01_29320 [Microbispora amethystogenes]